jgi:two-component system chemotaxis response regulator CheY
VEVGVRVDFASARDFLEAVILDEAHGEATLFVACDQALEPGAEIAVAVGYPGLSSALRCAAHVVWRRRVRESTDLEPAGMQLGLELDVPARTQLDAALTAARAQIEAQERMSTTCRVLVVDDSPETRRLFMFSAQRLARQAQLPIELVEASDGVAALGALAEGRFHLAIVDCHMPIMDGLELVQRIRSDARVASMPVVVVSHDAAARQEALAVGASRFLLKPVTSKMLLETIVALIDLGAP